MDKEQYQCLYVCVLYKISPRLILPNFWRKWLSLLLLNAPLCLLVHKSAMSRLWYIIKIREPTYLKSIFTSQIKTWKWCVFISLSNIWSIVIIRTKSPTHCPFHLQSGKCNNNWRPVYWRVRVKVQRTPRKCFSSITAWAGRGETLYK